MAILQKYLKRKEKPIMTNKVWCSDIYDLNSSNTTLSYDHDNLYREYAATSIGDLIDRMGDRIAKLEGFEDKLNEIRAIL